MKKALLFIIVLLCLVGSASGYSANILQDLAYVFNWENGTTDALNGSNVGAVTGGNVNMSELIPGMGSSSRNNGDADWISYKKNLIDGWGNITISLWLNTTNFDTGAHSAIFGARGAVTWQNIVSFANDGAPRYISWVLTTGAGRVTSDATADAWVKTGEKIHYVFRYNGSHMTTFVNGTPVKVTAQTQKISVNDMATYDIGRYSAAQSARDYIGEMGDIYFWNRSLTQDEINDLFVNESFYPFDAPAVPATAGLNVTWTQPFNNTHWNADNLTGGTTLSFNFTPETIEKDYPFNCSVLQNGVVNQTITGLTNNTEYQINITYDTSIEKRFNYSIYCFNNETNNMTLNRTVLVDFVSPSMVWNSPDRTNITIANGVTNYNITVSDSNLYSTVINITLGDGTILKNITNTSLTGLSAYTIFGTIDLSAYSEKVFFEVTGCDGHTAEAIPSYNVRRTGDTLRLDDVFIKSKSGISSVSYTKKVDRYSFAFNYASSRTSIQYEVPSSCEHLANSGYAGHFVCYDEKKWIDFSGKDMSVSVKDNVVTVTSMYPRKTWEFNSVGALNCKTEAAFVYSTTNTTVHEADVIEGSNQTYKLSIGIPASSSVNATARLIWNGTTYYPTVSRGTNDLNFTTNIVIPMVNLTTAASPNATVELHWNYTLNGTEYNTTVKNQDVHRIFIGNCSDSISDWTTYNLTFKNNSNSALVNVNLELTLDVWFSAESTFRNYSFAQSGINVTQFCLAPAFAQYWGDFTIAYTYESATYNYNTVNTSLNNISSLTTFYVESGTTVVTFTVTDQDDNPLEGYLIHVMAYDVATNSYNTVEIPATDYLGITLGNIVLNSQAYKFMIFDSNGVLRFESSNTFITGTSRTFRIDLTTDYFTDYNVIRGTITNLIFTNSTGNFAYTFADASGTVTTGCLKVIQRGPTTETIVGNSCVTISGTTTILVNINSTGRSESFLATGYLILDDGNQFVTDSLTVSFDDTFKTYGDDGLFYSFLIVLLLVMIGIFNPLVAIVLLVIGFIMVNVMGLFGLNPGFATAFIILAGIAIFKMSKSEN